MSYNDNNGGCCNGGWGGPFGGLMGGFGFDALILLLFFGLMGGGMWGGMGGWGGFGGGAGMLGTTSLAATETAALINQQNTADRVAAANAKADAIAGIVTANGTKIETVKDAVTNGFFANQTNLCELGNNIAQQFSAAAMNGMQNHNNLTSQLTEMRFDASKCCCETNQNIQRLSTQLESVKCSTEQAIAAAKSEILGAMNAQRMAELEAKNAKLENEISQSKQNATLIAAWQANQRGCTPCSPCCTPSPCDQLSAAIIAKGIDGIVNPVTPAQAAG
jgi:hypothetical protein